MNKEFFLLLFSLYCNFYFYIFFGDIMKSKTKYIQSIFGDEYAVEPVHMDCGLVDCLHCKRQCDYGVRYSSQILGGH